MVASSWGVVSVVRHSGHRRRRERWLWVIVVNVRGDLETHRCRSMTMVVVTSLLLKVAVVLSL